MPGLTDLETMLSTLEPTIREGEFVYVSVPEQEAHGLPAQALIHENEGVTMVLRREYADVAGIGYEFVASWITLTVHSSLEAVGLTAAFAAALGEASVSCNVLAGFHHDHILVPVDQATLALQTLQDLTNRPAHRALAQGSGTSASNGAW